MFRALVCSFVCASLASAAEPSAPQVRYDRDILPILSAACFACHGPDEPARKAGLRLDLRDGAVKSLRSGSKAVVPGKPDESELLIRIASDGVDRMPPAKHPHQLSAGEKSLLRRWIEQGAEYRSHWAFQAPVRPAPPAVKNAGWVRTPVDRFVLALIEAEGLKPSPEADRYALARRVALDLTGLPPTIEAADRFAKDDKEGAYERYVDEVLRSPAFGERWAAMWLDMARYADSNGYADDRIRTIWKYRDWTIDAFNRNLPFDRFTVEQLAGDLLPAATQDQLIATAFHRNTLTNDEGGTNDEEWRVAAVVDRVNTTFQVWMGLSMGCVQCHDHKFDPLRQEEYYNVFAILNQTQDNDQPDNTPILPVPTPEQSARKAALEKTIADNEKLVFRADKALDDAQDKWEASVKADKEPKSAQAILKVEAKKRSAAQKKELTAHFRATLPEFKEPASQLTAAKKDLAALAIPTVPILRELPAAQRRKTNIHIRGDWMVKGKEVGPAVPALFAPLPKDKPADRLALAQWLVDAKNPLTARVAVNRFWENIFGVGLVDTPEDFGVRGSRPTHPELLDWLAVEFAETGWDVKRFLKLLVTSAAYRQSSRVEPGADQRDPDNRLLARGPRFRSSAEVIRDQSLFAAGLLSAKMGGPPVRPYRPKMGLNAAFGGNTDWETSAAPDRWRRALYTEWRRTTPYPSMVAFDAPGRSVCTISRPRTNTPLQALVTLNDPVYVECAQALARRVIREAGSDETARAKLALRLCLTRPPTDAETLKVVELSRKAKAAYAARAKDAALFATDPIGPLPAGVDAVDAAAWTLVSNVLLNLDEVFSKR